MSAADLPDTFYDSLYENTTLSFVESGSTTKSYSREWLRLHLPHIRRFVNEKYIAGTYDQFLELVKSDPCLAHEILNDYLLPNEYKLKMVRDFVTTGSKIFVIEGDRGEGKTTAAHSFAEWFLNSGRGVCWVGPPQKLPDEFNRVIDPYDVPEGDGAFTDEVGLKYNSRKSGSADNIEDLQILLTLRQTFRSAFMITQLSALTDLNIIRSANALVFKPLSLFGQQLERDVIGSSIPDEFMPPSKGYTHFVCKEFRTTFRHPLGKLWKEDFSFPFAKVTNETVDEYIVGLVNDGFTPEAMVRELKARSYRIDVKHLKARLDSMDLCAEA